MSLKKGEKGNIFTDGVSGGAGKGRWIRKRGRKSCLRGEKSQ